MTSTSSSSFYPKPSSYTTPKTGETPETDKTSAHNNSNDVTQCIILPEVPSKADLQPLNVESNSILRTQTPVPPFYSKKIIPNPLHKHFKSTRIPSTPKPQSQSAVSHSYQHKTPTRDPGASHICTSYKDKPKQPMADLHLPHARTMFNATQFVISHSNLEVVGNNETILARKVPQRRANLATLEISDVVNNEHNAESNVVKDAERKIIKITDSLKEEVAAKQQRKKYYESEELGRGHMLGIMMSCGNNNNSSTNNSISVNNTMLSKERIVKLKCNSVNRCNKPSANTKLCYNNYIKPTSPNISSPSNNNYFFTQTNNTINNDMLSTQPVTKANKTIQTHCDNSFTNNTNVTNNDALLQYSYSTPPFEPNHFLNNTSHSIISTNSNNFNTSVPYHRYSTFNSHSPVNTTTTTAHNNPIIICNPSPKHSQYDSQYHSNHSVTASTNHTVSNLNQSYPINVYHPQTPTHQLSSSSNAATAVVDSYVKKTLVYTAHKTNGLSCHRKDSSAKHNGSLVKHIDKARKMPQQMQSQSFRTDKKKRYIHSKHNKVNVNVNEVSTTSRSPCSATKNTNSFLIKNKKRSELRDEPKGTKQVSQQARVRTERKGTKAYGKFCDNVKKHKKEDNVFLKLYSQIYLQLAQDK